MTKYHSAKLTLDALKGECEYIQNKEEAKLVHLQAVEVEIPVNNQKQYNKADYADVGGDLTKIPRLVFTAVNSSEDSITAHSDMVADNGYFIFDEILYIEGEEQRVFGYGVLD